MVYCVAVDRNIQPCFSRVASLCLVSRYCTVPPCIISFRAASSRPVLFSVSPCFFQAFVSCLPRLFSTYALFFPKGRYRAASFLSVSPDPALFRVALYLVPHRPIPSSSVAPCSVYSHSVSSAPHFSALRFAFSCVQFRILPRLVPHRIVFFYSAFFPFFIFLAFLFRPEAPSRISFP